MKKLMFALAAIVATAPLFAAVESPNIVGYTSTTCEAGKWYMLGCGFESTSGNSLNIQEFVSGLTARAENSAFIQVWNGTSLDTYFYQNDFDWDTFEDVPSWMNTAGVAADFEIPAGWACWFKEPLSTVTITVAGQVASTSEKEVVMAADTWYMVANPYPEAAPLNSEKFNWAGLTARSENSAFIQFWNGTSLDTYFYQNDFDWDTFEDVPAWMDTTGVQTDLSIPAMTGFWIKVPMTGGSFKWVF